MSQSQPPNVLCGVGHGLPRDAGQARVDTLIPANAIAKTQAAQHALPSETAIPVEAAPNPAKSVNFIHCWGRVFQQVFATAAAPGSGRESGWWKGCGFGRGFALGGGQAFAVVSARVRGCASVQGSAEVQGLGSGLGSMRARGLEFARASAPRTGWGWMLQAVRGASQVPGREYSRPAPRTRRRCWWPSGLPNRRWRNGGCIASCLSSPHARLARAFVQCEAPV